MRALLDLAAPMRCLACGDDSDGEICEACAGRITAVRRPFCERCGSPRERQETCRACGDLEGFVRARSVVVFAEPARSLALALKRRGRKELAGHMGSLLADLARAEGLDADVVTFVPAGRTADRRGFDPAKLLARAVARDLAKPLRGLVVRTAVGPRQADVALDERRHNARGRFGAKPTTGSVLLVDDVFTTGATAEACSLALVRAGASAVNVVTWARTLRRLYFRR